MRTFEHITHEEKGVGAGFDFTARLLVHAGMSDRRERIYAHSYGVEHGQPIVVVEQKHGDQRTQHGTMLQAIRPADARALAALLLKAADAADACTTGAEGK